MDGTDVPMVPESDNHDRLSAVLLEPGSPRSHPEVAEAVEDFARFAQDQYGDLVTLLSALSTKLQSTGNAYVKADAEAQRAMDDLLDKGRYVAPEDR